ncbi:thrombospondin type 3 repeat-containing protein [Cystobacter ferrugineus]|uniref:MYXO-CTERM domain-containing protein n=1 Tax=Cystobacter ferrugineus TaxID=83449 RepID=A0A1L9BHR2_9BACT|nr:thrombospondin type 3 repeat-containing protein [Cystobacter ferrugineus]OJH41807.1 hypothetical protein BON30_00765 [Cystobacter ferrugineus]
MNDPFHRGLPHVLARASLLGVILLGATAAKATPTFPGVINSELGGATSVSCPLCHQGMPSVGTVTTPFGKSILARNVEPGNEASLRKALAELDTEKVDSDGDGTPDTEELKAGRNPNSSDGTTGPGGEDPGGDNVLPDPSYGCAAAPGAPVGLLLGGLWLLRRRRRA